MLSRVLILLLLSTFNHLLGQDNVGFGEWVSHLPYQRGLSLTQSPNKIYFGTDNAVMSIDKEDRSLEFLSKVEGLSEIGIANLEFDEASGNLMIAYTNNEIDIVTPEGIINVADIRNNTGIIADKSIFDILFDGSRNAFLSTGFGVVSFDMETFEFGFTTQMGVAVNSCTVDNNNHLYAATEEGIYVLDMNRSFNFSDFGNWEFQDILVGLPLVYEAKDIAFYNDALYLLTENQVWRKKGASYERFHSPLPGESIEFLTTDGPELIIGSRFESDLKSQLTFVNSADEIIRGTNSCTNFITDALMEPSGRIWYADEWRGFRFTDDKNESCQILSPQSPLTESTSQLLVVDQKLYVASGGVSDGFNCRSNRDGVYILEDGFWKNYHQGNNDVLRNQDIINVYSIAKHPNNDKLYLGSCFSGVLEADLEAGNYQLYNSENSKISGPPGVEALEKVLGLAFDNQNTLWISSQDATRPLVAMTEDKTFHSFNLISSSRIAGITVDQGRNHKWVQVTGSSGGVLIYDDAFNVKDPSEHRQRFINAGNSNLPSSTVNCVEQDLDGTIWVGTGAGPVSFSCDVLDEDEGSFVCNGNINIVFEDSIPARLLETEDIRAIAFDGGNQKWFGTRNGIFVQSPSGEEKVARFTVDNSPLFDNNIIDLEFDPESGLMYIASDGGIQAYKTITTGGGRVHRSNVYAYPNPVRPEYQGLIAFNGLARDATIKVTDMNGQLVYQTQALGGQATWDGRDYNGRDVASGVYLVFSNSQEIVGDNPDTAVTKVLIVR